MARIEIGDYFGYGKKKKILDMIKLSNGWILLKTENSKSEKDFKVRTVLQTKPKLKYFTPKHAHFAIDFYEKICANKDKAIKVLNAILEVWNRNPAKDVLEKYEKDCKGLPGYDLEYILYALNWILEQEDINFKGRSDKKQEEIDNIFSKFNQEKYGFYVNTPEGRKGSELAISILCDIASGTHPVEALRKANLDIVPVKKGIV